MAACKSAIERKKPRRMRSGHLGKEVLDGVEPGGRGRSEVEGPARMASQPSQHFGMFMRGVVVEHRVDQLAGRDLARDNVEKADEFDMAVALHAAPDHRAVEHAERGEQGSGAVPLIIVGHRLAAPGLDRQSGLSAVERLDLALLVEAENHGVGGRIDIEPDDVGQLAAKLGSHERLKVRSRCGCSLSAWQMRCTEPSEMPTALAIDRPVQWVAWCGGSVQVSAATRAVTSAAIGALPGLRVLSRNRPSTPLSAKRCCHRHTVGRQCLAPPAAPNADPPRRARCVPARCACAAGCGRPRSPSAARAPRCSEPHILAEPWLASAQTPWPQDRTYFGSCESPE